ncbi:anaerobic sulfite reductase subunit A [Peptacetobacter hominis]|uniref:Anaerobic sulfite reductase subunit A n=1 Tax=Peptacetobacter hominis TaxID=2743610 RepID=A0A544QT52_9FIRM|nr:anaerobic sulfite reductase subunit AsrA [Peptacetobacter hominis]TQQ83215.1 anaerobic sulfite reductase subunit A [Peptacetobacter hominis]
MGYKLNSNEINKFFESISDKYDIYAPKCFEHGGRFSDTDCIRYGKVKTIDEIVFDRKSDFSFKEILLPVSQTLFFFSEEFTKESDTRTKGAVIFLRSCDLHALKRLDDMYLNNGPKDYYYSRLRENIKFVLIGCHKSFDNCFCVSMNTNTSDNYDLSIDTDFNGNYYLDCKDKYFESLLMKINHFSQDVSPSFVYENSINVSIPEKLSSKVTNSSMWNEYDSRCINCGRCNFVCPTCTCFTMQDIFYSENGKSGERRRIWASCMVDGFTDVAGGGNYRKKNGERMRFKVLHKVLDYRERNGYNMCVGCGRCDDICPEYISFSNCINKLEKALEEVENND